MRGIWNMSDIVLAHGNHVMNVYKQSKEGKGKRTK